MKHSTLVSLVLLCMTLVGLPTAAQITGWDEVGPTISGAQESLTAVKKNGLWGFATQKNKAKIKPKYEAIGDTVCFLTTSGTTLNQGILIQEKGKWGLLGADGKILIKPEYDSFGDFYSTESNGYSKTPYEGRALAKVGDRQYLVNTSGKKLKAFQGNFSDIQFYNGMTFGLNSEGEPVVIDSPTPVEFIHEGNGLYLLDMEKNIDARAGRMQKTAPRSGRTRHGIGETLYYYAPAKDFVTSSSSDISPNYYIVKNSKGLIGLMNKNLNYGNSLLTDICYTDIVKPSQKMDDGHNIILHKPDGTSDLLHYDKVIHFDKKIIDVSGRGQVFYTNDAESEKPMFGIMDYEGQIITEPKYNGALKLEYDGIALFKDGAPAGVINSSNKLMEFPEGCETITQVQGYCYNIDGKAGHAQIVVDKCEYIIPFSGYKDAVPAAGDKFIVKGDDGKYGIVDVKTDKVIIPKIYDSIKEIKRVVLHSIQGQEAYRVTKNGKQGVIDINGKTIIPLGKYKQITDHKVSYYIVKNGNKFGLVNENGTQIVPPVYDGLFAAGNNNIMVYNRTANGFNMVVFSNKGKILKTQNVGNSDMGSYWFKKFRIDWLGNNYSLLE